MADPKWKKFERIVAAIHEADAHGAKVCWNEEIRGRQFDVVLRFSVGSYSYLTVIECKDQQRPVSVDQVEAFVTKSRDAGADKAVMVSSSSFQAGAFSVADRHNIELFGLSFVDDVPADHLYQELFPCLQIYQMRLRRPDPESWLALPDDRNLPPYLAVHLTIRTGSLTQKLHELVDSNYSKILNQATSEPQEFRIPLPSSAVAFVPHLRQEFLVLELSFLYRITSFQVLKQPGLDPFLLSGIYEYRDLRTGTVRQIPKYRVRMSHPTVFQPGKFYFGLDTEFSYYCQRIEGELAKMILVESYQHGMLVQAEYTQAVKYQDQYVEITDAEEIARLKRVAQNILRKHGAV